MTRLLRKLFRFSSVPKSSNHKNKKKIVLDSTRSSWSWRQLAATSSQLHYLASGATPLGQHGPVGKSRCDSGVFFADQGDQVDAKTFLDSLSPLIQPSRRIRIKRFWNSPGRPGHGLDGPLPRPISVTKTSSPYPHLGLSTRQVRATASSAQLVV